VNIKLAQFKEHLSHFEKVIIGHRGAAALAPENTLGSFKIACELGCPLIELDVHQIRDDNNANELIVIHDDTLDRTTNHTGEVSQISLPDLPQILTKDGTSIPLLSEVISLIENEMKTMNTVIGLNIELKGDNTGLLTANYMKAIDVIPTIVSSFKLKELRAFRAADKDTPIAPLFHRWEDSCTEIGEELNAVAINCSAKIVNENRVKLIKERGFKVFVYTVNSQNKAEELFNMGVDGIFTDHPDKMKHWLNYSNTDSFR
tara:strand:+ start:69 stop:848 length:780 start_codon:yes stop_codon:yes gene_type:complete